MAKNRRGFTLIELVVVVLIMGILASMGIPYYYKTVETTRATDALAIGHLLGNANRMYLIDNAAAPVSGTITNACNTTGNCSTAIGPCKLVACNYVAAQDWTNASYDFFVCNGATGGACCAANTVSCVARKAGAPANYATWGYRFYNDGSCRAIAATTGAFGQPDCPKF